MEPEEPASIFPIQMKVGQGFTDYPITTARIAWRLKGLTWEDVQGAFESHEPKSNVMDMEGFSWQSEGFEVAPTCPFGNTSSRPIGFVKVAGTRVPEVRHLGGPAPVKDYAYKLHGYRGTPLPDVQGLNPEDLEFVFIAETKAVGPMMPSRFFMRLEDLKERLCGSFDRRLELYTLDWLVGATQRTSKEEDFSLPPSLNLNDKSMEGGREEADDIVKMMDKEKYRSHLPVWDQNGKLLDWSVSADVLRGLFSPSAGDSEDLKFIPEMYFRNLCRLVVAAATIPRVPFTVMARFWSRKVPNQHQIVFRYTFPQLKHAWGKGIDEPGRTFWEKTIKSTHKKVVEELTAYQVKHPMPALFIPSKTCKVDMMTDVRDEIGHEYHWVGSHPQGLYDLSIRTDTLIKMAMASPSLRPRPPYETTPTRAKIGLWKASIGNKAEPQAKTHTIIGRDKLIEAATWPRKCTQNSLMNNLGAGEIAEDLFSRVNPNPSGRGMAEWLHRSAYSFGGLCANGDFLDPGNPDTAQERSNLVLGTYAANTRMIRYEEYLKRLVNHIDDKCIRLTTSLIYHARQWPYAKPELDQNSSWIAPELNYHWEICGVDGETQYAKGITRFELLSRTMPMRFEVMMDETLDLDLYKLYNEDLPDSPLAIKLLDTLWKQGYIATSM